MKFVLLFLYLVAARAGTIIWESHWQSPLSASLVCQTNDALIWSVENKAPARYGATQHLMLSRQMEPEFNDRLLSIDSGHKRLLVSYEEKADADAQHYGHTLFNSSHVVGTWIANEVLAPAQRTVLASPLAAGIVPSCYCGSNVVCRASAVRVSTTTLNQGYHPIVLSSNSIVHPSPNVQDEASIKEAQLQEQALVGSLAFGPTSMAQYLPMFYLVVGLSLFIYAVGLAAYLSNGPSLFATNGWLASLVRYRLLGLGRPLDPSQADRAENPAIRGTDLKTLPAEQGDEPDRLPTATSLSPV
jgi:hypothetical protein